MARRYDHLYAGLTSFANLSAAYHQAAKGKRSHPETAGFEFALEDQLFQLQSELETQVYHPGAYRSFYIRDPKRRLISAAPFRDRVVHHALCNVIEPLFEPTFIIDSYANRVGKGTHAALDRAQSFARRYRYVLQCDVRQFFPSIDLALLAGLLRRKIADEQVLWLCDQILNGGAGVLDAEYEQVYFPGDDLLAALRPRGLPIGNLTSQFWANIYLNELDQRVKRDLRAPAYLRYVDDMLLFSDDKAQLWGWKSVMRHTLQDLRLTLHEGPSTVYPVVGGIPFLGFRLYPQQRRLKRRNGIAFQRRYRYLRAQYARGAISMEELGRSVRGWLAHAAHGNTRGLQIALLQPVIQSARPG